MPTNVLYKRYVPMHANRSDLFGSSGFDGSTEPNLSLATNWLKVRNHLSQPHLNRAGGCGKSKSGLTASQKLESKYDGTMSMDDWTSNKVGKVNSNYHSCVGASAQ